MRKYLLLFFSFCTLSSLQAQDLVKYNPVKAEIIAGNEELEQVLQTQLNLFKNFFNGGFRGPVNIYFLVDSVGKAHHITVKISNILGQREFKRILSYLRFRRMDGDPNLPYYLSIDISADRYDD